jgi:hypothetical protein
VYLAGTQAAASIKVGAMVVLGVAWASRERSEAAVTSVAKHMIIVGFWR